MFYQKLSSASQSIFQRKESKKQSVIATVCEEKNIVLAAAGYHEMQESVKFQLYPTILVSRNA